MSIFNEFPYTNFHELNLDWLIKQVKATDEKVDNFILETDDKIISEVDSWLDRHPEATTTVMDGALTLPKFSESLKLVTVKDYDTPEMYGAKGDGVTDDTEALAAMFNAGKGCYRLNADYAISERLNVSGHIFGHGTVRAYNKIRINDAFFNLTGDLLLEGVSFDCESNIPFTGSDYPLQFNMILNCEENDYDVIIDNVKAVNGYTIFVRCYHHNGYFRLSNCNFKATLTNNRYTGYMFNAITSGTTKPLEIYNNYFEGNGTLVDNFAGLFFSNITDRQILIHDNVFKGVGRDKTGGYQSCCIDGYFNVSYLNIHNNIFDNPTYTVLRLHGGYRNTFSNNLITQPAAGLAGESCILIQDDSSSTGASPVGVDNINILNNVFVGAGQRFWNLIQLTSTNSNNNGSITNVNVNGNYCNVYYTRLATIDGSVKSMTIANNTFRNGLGGLTFINTGVAFSSACEFNIHSNYFRVGGGSAIVCESAMGNARMLVTSNMFRTYGYAWTCADTTITLTYAIKNTIDGSQGFNNVNTVGDNMLFVTNTAQAIVGAVRSFANYVNGSAA